jgi:hypothetical protein
VPSSFALSPSLPRPAAATTLAAPTLAATPAEELTFSSVIDVIRQSDGGLLVHDQQAGLIRFYDDEAAIVKTGWAEVCLTSGPADL